MSVIILFFAVAAAFWISKYLYILTKNYVTASRIGLPFLTIPIDQNDWVWMAAGVALQPWMARHLPSQIYNRLKYAIYGWEYHEKLTPFHWVTNADKKGTPAYEKTFVLSTFGRFELWTADPAVAQQILLRPNDFHQFEIGELFIGIFGKNVLCADGEMWSRHRKVVASAVTERISPVVWTESVKQTKGMLEEICGEPRQGSGETNRLFDMLKTVTIHVLSKAGLGVEKSWTSDSTSQLESVKGHEPEQQQEISYMDAVKMLNDNMTGPLIMPTKALLNWPSLLPGYADLRRLGLAKVFFPIRTKEMLSKEKLRLADNKGEATVSKANLLSMLVAASDNHTEETFSQMSQKRSALSDEELTSNLFVFTAAGYDTTAATLSYAITLLMRYPKWQDWLFAEVDTLRRTNISGDNDNDTELPDYQAIFPKCVRILAFMFETLRLFPALIHGAKMTRTRQTLTMPNGKQVVIPARTTVFVNFVSLHLNHTIWRDLNLTSTEDNSNTKDWEDDMPGRYSATADDRKLGGGKLGDEWRFRPTRWINPTASSTGQTLNDETLFQPPRGTFLPWSMGPRVCPGQRMAQVEFTAILFVILSEFRLEVVPHLGESREALNKRLDLTMRNSTSKLALEMDVFNKGESPPAMTAAEVKDVVSTATATTAAGLRVRLLKR